MLFEDYLKKAKKEGKEPDVSYIFKEEQNIKLTTKNFVKPVNDFKMIHTVPTGMLFTNEYLAFRHLESDEILDIEEV